MAEQVNQRIEDMINELEQMRRTNLYDDEEIKEISRKRKEFEYKVQRRLKEKEDYVQYIAYELALLEDISLRRRKYKLEEKKKDIEYAIAKRLLKLFKQFIYRFQDDIAIYFEYIKFCKSVGFTSAVSGIIGQMLQIHGDKPCTWQLAAKWESIEQDNLESARSFLLKGIHRHPESELLYLDLFETELMIAYKAENEEEKEKLLKRAEVIWKNGVKSVNDISFLFKLCDISLKFDVFDIITKDIMSVIWSRRDQKEVWIYIANKELNGHHWEEIEEFFEENSFSKEVNNYIAVYEEALQQFPDKSLCKRYIHGLLGVKESVCTEFQKINAVKHAWRYGHENGLLSDDMLAFGIEMLKLDSEMSDDDLTEILDTASKHNPQSKYVWEEKINIYKADEKQIFKILEQASKALKSEDMLHLWNFALDNVDSKNMLQSLYKRFKNCENSTLLSIKPKLLKKMYEHTSLKVARDVYEEMIRTPPTQIEIHRVMIEIENSQGKPNVKNIRKYYECAVQHHGSDCVDLWMDYITFETQNGNAQAAPALYRRAVGTLKKDLVDEFIKLQTLAKVK